MSFLVSPEHKLLVMPDPQRVCSLVDTARSITHNGHQLAVVPHGVVEAAKLREAGYPVPSPIGYRYNWPGKYEKPFDHQKETAAFATFHRRLYILNGIGTAKTLSAIWAADFMMRERVIRKVLVVAPLSTLDLVWGNEIFLNVTDRTYGVVHGTSARRHKVLASDRDFYIVNHDGVETIAEALQRRPDIDLVIIDELAHYANQNTDKWRALKSVITPLRRAWGMTATPIANEPSDAWAQGKLITPWTMPPYFTAFRNMTMVQRTQYRWEPREEAPRVVYAHLTPAVRYARDECLDLPPTLYQDRAVELTAVQKKHYTELQKELYTEHAEGKVTAINEGVKRMRLIQAACGVLYDTEGRHIPIDARPRMQLVFDTIAQAGEKVIVFAPFIGVVHLLRDAIAKHWPCELVYGAISKGRRNEIFAEFQSGQNLRVLVAHPECMAHGLTLTASNTIIWYGPPETNDEYMQANGRITRAGQRFTANIINVQSTALERNIYKRFRAQESVQGILLEMVRKGEPL